MKANIKLDEAPAHAEQSTRLAKITGVGSVVVALLASQHHLLHMVILLVTLGMAGMSGMGGMAGYPPLVREGMLLMSVVMVGVTIWQMRAWRNNPSMLILGSVSIALTLGLIVWSISQYGLL
ncbi:MAG TPA: hypothetical protein VE338_11700 [Ktedonobacterales bacterium]|nr:hypothetical protein [Ktedonobacterales bacterium]